MIFEAIQIQLKPIFSIEFGPWIDFHGVLLLEHDLHAGQVAAPGRAAERRPEVAVPVVRRGAVVEEGPRHLRVVRRARQVERRLRAGVLVVGGRLVVVQEEEAEPEIYTFW